MLTVLFAGLLYVAAAFMVVGVAWRVLGYARTPAPLKIPTTPAPITMGGVVLRLLREVVLFESLFKATKWTWLFGWLFHAGMLLVVLGHLRYFTEPTWGWVVVLRSVSLYVGLAMLVGLVGLWIRRIAVDRVRYISAPSDHLMLALLVGIAGTGLLMRTASHTDVVALKAFALGLVSLDLQPLPADGVLLVHLLLVAALMIVFPLSKLMHAPGLFFSPTRNQVDNPRERRHLSAWASELESHGGP
jgi:nitrate reductase gamma subunit